MEWIRKISSNGFMAIFPILLWNVFLTSKLPEAFNPKTFNSNMPLGIIVGENIFRAIIFLMPLFLRFDITLRINKKGLVVYSFGVLLYVFSWLVLIHAPDSAWSNSILGFSAPAYTPLIWLIGLSMLVKPYNLNWVYSKWHYILPSVAFTVFHVAHTGYVYNRGF